MSRNPQKLQMNKPSTDNKEWPLVVYMWALVLGLVGYLVIGEMIFEMRPHPIHWLSGVGGGILGVALGWIWFRWRGDII